MHGRALIRVGLARRQTLRHPSGECSKTAPGGIRFLIHSGTLFHLPTINRISVIINLQGQPSSETPCIIRCRVSCRLCDFVMWTPRDKHIEYIYGDDLFWEDVLPRLQVSFFFFFHVMPSS